MKKTKLYGYFYDFSINYDSIHVADILDLHKHLMKQFDAKQCLYLFLKCLQDYK